MARRGQKDGLLHPPGKEEELVRVHRSGSKILLDEIDW